MTVRVAIVIREKNYGTQQAIEALRVVPLANGDLDAHRELEAWTQAQADRTGARGFIFLADIIRRRQDGVTRSR